MFLQETNSPGQHGSPLSVAPMSHATMCDEGSILGDSMAPTQPIDEVWVEENADYEVSLLEILYLWH